MPVSKQEEAYMATFSILCTFLYEYTTIFDSDHWKRKTFAKIEVLVEQDMKNDSNCIFGTVMPITKEQSGLSWRDYYAYCFFREILIFGYYRPHEDKGLSYSLIKYDDMKCCASAVHAVSNFIMMFIEQMKGKLLEKCLCDTFRTVMDMEYIKHKIINKNATIQELNFIAFVNRNFRIKLSWLVKTKMRDHDFMITYNLYFWEYYNLERKPEDKKSINAFRIFVAALDKYNLLIMDMNIIPHNPRFQFLSEFEQFAHATLYTCVKKN